MNQDNELRSIFQKQFETASETAPQSVWGGLESRLAEMRNKRKRKLIFLWGASVLLIGVITGAALLFTDGTLSSSNEFETPLALNQLEVQAELDSSPTNRQAEQEKDLIQLVTASNQFPENAESHLTETTEKELNEKQNPPDKKYQTKSGDGSTSTDLNQKTTGNSGQKTSPNIGTSANQTNANTNSKGDPLTQNPNLNGTAVHAIGMNPQDQLLRSASTDQKDQNESKNADSDLPNLSATKLNGFNAKPNGVSVETTSNQVALMNKMAQKPALKLPILLSPLPEIQLTPLPPKKSNWELTLYGGGGRQMRKTNLNEDNLSYFDFSSTRPNTQAFHCSGVRISYFLGDHLSIGTGLETSVWRYRTRDYQKQLPQQENYEFDSPVGKLPASAADFNAFYTNDPDTDTVLVKMRMIQRLRYIGIPLNVQYNFGTSKVKPYIRMGAVGNFLVRQRTVLMAENAGIKREVNYKNIEGFNRFQLTLQPAIGLNWQLSKRLGFYCEGLINLPVTKFYTPPSGEFQKISSQGTGANMGIRIYF